MSYKISAALIVKNESRCIERCLLSIIHEVDEIIIVDTGSTDNTVQIITDLKQQHRKIKLFHFEWCDDFSKARNFSLSKVTGHWCLTIDADEYIHPDDKNQLRAIADSYRKYKYPIIVKLKLVNIIGKGSEVLNLQHGFPRFFPTKFNLHYSGIIHESLNIKQHKKFLYADSNIRICTDGYDPQIVNSDEKLNRNLVLINKALETSPNDFSLLFFLGRETSFFDLDKGAEIVKEALKYAPSVDDACIFISHVDYKLAKKLNGAQIGNFDAYIKF